MHSISRPCGLKPGQRNALHCFGASMVAGMESHCKGSLSLQHIQRIRNVARSLTCPKQSRKPFSSAKTVNSTRCCTSSQEAAGARSKVDMYWCSAAVDKNTDGRTSIASLSAEQRRYEQQRQGL